MAARHLTASFLALSLSASGVAAQGFTPLQNAPQTGSFGQPLPPPPPVPQAG
eukprot:gene60301-80417_t